MATEATTTTEATEAESITVPAFEDALLATQLPPVALAPAKDKFYETFGLITENNKRIAQVNAAKGTDPSKPGYEDYLDDLWAAHVVDDPEIAEIEPQYQKLIEETEKLQKRLRELAKKHIPEQLSEEQTQNVRKLVNETAPTISKAKEATAAMLSMVDAMLASIGKGIDGGLVSLLPEIDSLKNARGRKASSGEAGKVYMTRVGEIMLDGKSTNIEGKGGKFNYAADALSIEFGSEAQPANAVTALELEEAYFASLEVPWRSVKSTEIPESHTFTFTKDVRKQNANDDSTTTAPVSKKITVYRVGFGPEAVEAAKNAPAEKVEENKAPEAKPETKSAEKPAEAKKVEAPKVENPKAAPAKK